MNNLQIGQYLNRGFIWDYTCGSIPTETNLSFEDSKYRFYNLLDDNIKQIISRNKKVLWTMSSGLDTSSILSHAKKYDSNLHTICLDNGRTDVEDSIRLAKDWGFKNHKILTIPNEFPLIEKNLSEMNDLFSTPYAHSYLYFSYSLFKYAEENGYDALIMGDGPDVSMMGTYDLHKDIILTAIKLKQYNVEAASDVAMNSSYLETTSITSSRMIYESMLKYVNANPIYNDQFFYYLWSKEVLPKNLVPEEFKLKENTLKCRINTEWSQFLFRTRRPSNLLLSRFNFKQISPYLNNPLCNFILSLPPHYKYTLNSTKHLMREIYGDYLPDYILNKERTGFNPNDIWANKYSLVIDILLDKYIMDQTKKIHNHIDVENLILSGDFTFNRKWSLINLSMWIEKWL